MIPINSLRIIFNGFVRRGALIPQQIHFSKAYSTLLTVEERLGLPKRPKRPSSAYIRFYVDNLAKVIESNPNIKQKDRIQRVAGMWKALSDAQRWEYLNVYHEKKVDYMTQIKEYNRTLSDEDKERIYKLKAKISKRKQAVAKLKKIHELGKPKRPINPFMKFLRERRRGLGGKRQTKAEHHKFYRDTANDWHAMSEADRAKYDASAEKEKYKHEMYEWEAEMIRNGLGDVVRSNVVLSSLLSKSKKKC